MARWLLLAALLFPASLPAGTAGDLAEAVRQVNFDSGECYRVRDLALSVEDIRLFFSDGHMIFSKPVAGRRIAAVFVADTDGGDGEALLMPPDRAERSSLAGYIDSPNLDEHFDAAVLLFTGDVYEKLKSSMADNPFNRKSPESAPLLEERWTPVLRNLAGSYQTRLTLDLMGGYSREAGLFAAILNSPKLGGFDLMFDPEASEQILAGRLATRDNRLLFDTWTSFKARSFRADTSARKLDFKIADYRIEAAIDPDLSMKVVTRLKVTPELDGLRALPFDIAPQMQVTEATIDGRPAEVLQPEALRLNAIRGGNGMFLAIPPEPLRRGSEYEVEIHHSGKVVQDTGDRVFYVSARANWYPVHGGQFASYDLLFRYPRDLDVVAPGDVVEDRMEGEQRITRRRTSMPIRVAAFNLGPYEHTRATRGEYRVDVCANRAIEEALKPKPNPFTELSSLEGLRKGPGTLDDLQRTVNERQPDPLGKARELATDVASALEFMASKFGPPALPHLAVSPIPGNFGQGFPGLIYIPTRYYLPPEVAARGLAPQAAARSALELDLLVAHETAHQWWGNRVSTGAYRDYWLMEALANYSAAMYVEKTRGKSAMETVLEDYRRALLEKNESGQTVESTGPIVLGGRLENSLEPRAWRDITYGKGTWILQMLRARMGDDKFLALLAETARRYDRKEITTEQFRELAAAYMPPKSDDPALESFFDAWVYGTGIPTLTLSYSIKGKAPSVKLVGTVTQADVPEDFSALVPIEIQAARGRTVTEWVRTGGDGPASFTIPLKQRPLKVTLDPRDAVLRK
jgi:hypothetical protein